MVHEVNFDGIVGPTHSYAGLAYGNVASMHHTGFTAHPRAACLEGLAQMKLLMDLGLKQGVFPTHPRPDLRALRRVGFSGPDDRIVERAAAEAPALLAAAYSASSMWAANAGTVSAGIDTADGGVHFTPANLVGSFHRSLETSYTALVFKTVFNDDTHFVHHEPLPSCLQLADEGAANHTRLCRTHAQPGINVFTYGRSAFARDATSTVRYPARQTLEASSATARVHGLDPSAVLFVKQNPAAIDAGVFHNDVIAVGNENVFLFHEEAYEDGAAFVENLCRSFQTVCEGELACIDVREHELTLDEAVSTYLFNSRIVTLPSGSMCLIAPTDVARNPRSKAVVERILADDNPMTQVEYVEIRQSMQNGGGPACLRLRVPLTDEELASVLPSVLLTDELYRELCEWANRYYRESLHIEDLADPLLIWESRSAHEALLEILGLKAIRRHAATEY